MVKGMAKGMDFSIDAWMEEYQRAVKERFGGRVWFIGLQGSFGRGEATEGSDIDAVLILDTVSAADLQAYGDLLDGLPQRDRVCGFVSGREELLAWEPSDLFQFIMIPCRCSVPWMNCQGGSAGRMWCRRFTWAPAIFTI